jgi:hypothetical protein
VYPSRANLHALFALAPLRLFDARNRFYMRASLLNHGRSFYSASTWCTNETAIEPLPIPSKDATLWSAAAWRRFWLRAFNVEKLRQVAALQGVASLQPIS